ncbi:hypothetical protein PR001_g6897 [Phytophthora rubi]|uniref:Retrotransposon gag domain-containing protein n=2 Tax=Phytophthora rubi TaxID=129364 RepID=A0A6A3NB29_9STRA|nr:hypothetical protein PR001_g6897 [Phytophthora rubi]
MVSLRESHILKPSIHHTIYSFIIKSPAYNNKFTAASSSTRMADLAGNEPDPEPSNSKKLSTKQVQIESFSGEVKDGFLDAGAGDWLKRLIIQIRLGEMVDGKVCPDGIKLMVVAAHLKGAASTWFMRKFDSLQAMTFGDFCEALRERFRCNLDRLEISAALGRTMKRANESYADFGHRFHTIAATMNNGEESRATAEDALSTFVKSAWSQHRAPLLSCVKMQSGDPWAEMDAAIMYLTKVAGHDGRRRIPNASAPAAAPQEKQVPIKRREHPAQDSGKRSLKAPRRDFSNATCSTCNRCGYTTSYHDQWAARQGNAVHARLANIARSITYDDCADIFPNPDDGDEEKCQFPSESQSKTPDPDRGE